MTLLRVNPFHCKVWDLHDRLGEHVDTTTCASLLSSIEKNGQLQPALGRRLPAGSEHKIELIYGARRLFVAQQLGVQLLVEVHDIDDRTGLVEMDAENRVRSDITPYERGRSYRRWLSAGYFRSQLEIAQRLSISEAQVSRLLRYAELPAAVVAAFSRPGDIQEEWAVTLARCCKDAQSRATLVRRARQAAKHGFAAPHAVYEYLLAARGKSEARNRFGSHDEVVKDHGGRPLFRASFRSRNIHLIVPRDAVTNETLESLLAHLASWLSQEGRPSPPSGRKGRFDGETTGNTAAPHCAALPASGWHATNI